MTSTAVDPTSVQVDAAQVREHVARILASPPFARAPRMQRFLAFLVDEALAGRAARLKEYTIAVSVFDKPADFESGTSAAVRVEAGRLRKLLAQYQAECGGADTILIEVPKGSYVPTFRALYDQKAATQRAPESEFEPASHSELASRPWSAEERRLITVMSCAFGNQTDLAQAPQAAEYLRSFDIFHEKCVGIARKHGGTVDGGASDRLIIYFGWPTALEDAAGRALTAALEMLAAIQEVFGGGPLGIRIGIATSDAVTRRPQTSEARPAVIGEAPSSATRILLQVPLNGVVVAESTRRLTSANFDFIPAGAMEGTDHESKLLWRLLRARTTLTRFRAAHAGAQSPIFGRREEMNLIVSRWRLAEQGEGQGVVIVGDAGIGKSRLAESVLACVGDEISQIRVQCSPHHANSTLYPFIELIRNHIGLHSEAAADRHLNRFLARFKLDEPLDRILLATLLSQSNADSLHTLSASQRKSLTLRLLTRILAVQISRRPTLLLIEDVHWADPTTIELLQDILRLSTGVQLMVMLTSREDPGAWCSQQSNVTSVRLARLPKKDCNAVIDGMLEAAQLSPLTRALILDKAEGIPLYLEELTKLFLADENRLRGSSVPERLSDLLASQLDRLGATRGIARVAAVIGRQFSRDMLTLASGHARQDVDTALDQLLAAGVIVRDGVETSQLFAFRHALLRDAAYGSILDHTCRELHYRVGSVLVDAFPDVAVEHPEIVAKHMMDAGHCDEAIPFWLDAGRKAATRYALTEAVADFQLALDALKTLPGNAGNRERELQILIDLGFVIRHARGYGDPDLSSIYERAREIAAQQGRREQLANAVYGLWTHAAGRGEWKRAAALASEFEALSRQMDDTQLEVEAYRLLGASAAFRGEFSMARRHFERALSSYEPHRHGPRFGFDPAAVSAAYMSWTVWHLGHAEEAKAYAQQALAIAERTNHPVTLAMVLSWLIFYEICARNVDAVIEYNERLQALCSERDCRYWQPLGAACAEWAAFQRDGHARHLDALLEHTAGFREHYLTSCLLLLGAEMCGDLGRLEQGLELTASAQRFMEEHDERVWEAECSRLTAELLLQSPSPNLPRAKKLLLRAVRTARHQEALELERRAAATLSAANLTDEPTREWPVPGQSGTVH